MRPSVLTDASSIDQTLEAVSSVGELSGFTERFYNLDLLHLLG